MKRNRGKRQRFLRPKVIGPIVLIALVVTVGAWFALSRTNNSVSSKLPFVNKQNQKSQTKKTLDGVTFYVNPDQQLTALAASYTSRGQTEEAALISKITDQPTAIWLTGPNGGDRKAQADINSVTQSSTAAAAENKTPVYVLYAIPVRDACAQYSNGGFMTADDYSEWIQNLASAAETKSVFVLEPDAIAHAAQGGCLNAAQTSERYAALSSAVSILKQSPMTAAVYIDSGHSEWFPDQAKLVESLQKSGIGEANGVAVNVSNYIATPEITQWSKSLVDKLGANKTALIDTSRNGKGATEASVQGEARWCNPRNRGLGHAPTTSVADVHVDAYFWGKKPGESDGACFGFPEAGTLVPILALELARNAQF